MTLTTITPNKKKGTRRKKGLSGESVKEGSGVRRTLLSRKMFMRLSAIAGGVTGGVSERSIAPREWGNISSTNDPS